MGLTTFLTMTRFGVALATTQACRATPNYRLPNAASSGRDESTQRASSFSGVYAFWSPGVRPGLVPYRDALKFTFAQLPGNNGVDVGVVHNDESRSAPADRTSRQELQRSCHGRFFAPDGGKTLPS